MRLVAVLALTACGAAQAPPAAVAGGPAAMTDPGPSDVPRDEVWDTCERAHRCCGAYVLALHEGWAGEARAQICSVIPASASELDDFMSCGSMIDGLRQILTERSLTVPDVCAASGALP